MRNLLNASSDTRADIIEVSEECVRVAGGWFCLRIPGDEQQTKIQNLFRFERLMI